MVIFREIKIIKMVLCVNICILTFLLTYLSLRESNPLVSCQENHQNRIPLFENIHDPEDVHDQRRRYNIYSRYFNILDRDDDDDIVISKAKVKEDDEELEEAPKSHQKSEFVDHGLIYFQISEPENLRYTFKAKTSRIGMPFNQTLANIALVLAEPRAACTSIINRLEIRDNIALVERGFCPFLEKCIAIQRSGGIGVIVYDNDKNNNEEHIEMIDDSTPRNCSIPAVYVLGKDGHMIVQSLLALRLTSAIITIPIKTSDIKDAVHPPWLLL